MTASRSFRSAWRQLEATRSAVTASLLKVRNAAPWLTSQ